MLTDYVPGLIDTIWPIVFVLVISVLFVVFQDRIRASRLLWFIPLFMFVLSVVYEFNLIGNMILGATYSFKDFIASIPMHLCSMSVFMIWLYYLTKKDLFFQIAIFQGVIGALVTFAFPDVHEGPDTYYYWKFLLSHAILFLMPVYYWIIERKTITKQTLFKALIAFHIFGFSALAINLYTDSNYMYINPDNTINILSKLPAHELIPFFGEWPGVLVFGELLSLTVYGVFYVLYRKLQPMITSKNTASTM